MKIKAWINIQLDDTNAQKISRQKKFTIKDNLTEEEQIKEVINEIRTLMQANNNEIDVARYNNFKGDKILEGHDKSLKYYFCEFFFKKDKKFAKQFVVAMPTCTTEPERRYIMNSIAMKYIKWGFTIINTGDKK